MSANPDRDAIRLKLRELVGAALSCPPEAIDASAPLDGMGLDSIRAFEIAGDLADWLDREIPATLLWDHPSIEALAGALAEEPETPA